MFEKGVRVCVCDVSCWSVCLDMRIIYDNHRPNELQVCTSDLEFYLLGDNL